MVFTSRKNAADGNLTFTISTGGTSGNDTTHSDVCSEGDLIAIKTTGTGTVNAIGCIAMTQEIAVAGGTAYTQTLSDTVTLTDSIIRQAGKVLSDTVTHTESIIKQVLRSLTETVAHTDSIEKQTSKPLTETVTHTDSISISHLFTTLLSETISLTDTLVRQGQKGAGTNLGT